MCQRQPPSSTGWPVSGRAEIHDARGLGLQVGGAQVQMEPVLLALDVGHPLQQHVDPDTADRREAAIRAAGEAADLVAEHGGPNCAERSRSEQSMTTTSSPFG